MVKLSKQMDLIRSVSQCIKDAECATEVIKEHIPRMRARFRKEQSKRSLEFFEAVIYHLKRLQELEKQQYFDNKNYE